MKKGLLSMIVLACLVFALTVPAGAAPQIIQETGTIATVYGDIEVETITTIHSLSRSNSKSVETTNTYKKDGQVIAEVTLKATFGYDGKTSWVISASSSHTTYDGWSYGNERISKSGGTASLSATLSKAGAKNVPVNISITCTASGSIS